MPINDPTTPQKAPFSTAEPVVEYWDTVPSTPTWRTFPLGRMYLDKLTLRQLNQGISEASLRYECGDISFESGAFSVIQPLSIDRTWIRVTMTTDDVDANGVAAPVEIVWAGIITNSSEDNRALKSVANRLLTQRFTALGMEFLMSRYQIVESNKGSFKKVGYGLTFNAHADAVIGRHEVKGNMGPGRLSFSVDDRTAATWTGFDIVHYLWYHYFPTGDWTWGPNVNLTLLKWLKPVVEVHGRSLLQILTSLSSPQRGMTSLVEYTKGGSDTNFGEFVYRLDSMLSAQVKLPSGIIVAKNSNVVTIAADDKRAAFTAVRVNSTRRYDKVVATGAPKGAVLTFANLDGNMNTGWTNDDRDSYKTGDPDVQTTDDLSRQRSQHDRYRRQKYPQVFTEFHVPVSWNGFSRGGNRLPTTDAFRHLRAPNEIYAKDMRFSNYMPLKVGFTYGSSAGKTDSAPDIDEFRKPFVAFELNELAPDSSDLAWEYGDQLKKVVDEVSGENGYDFTCFLRPLNRRLGISVAPSNINHVISRETTAEQIVTDTSDDAQNQLNYRQMIVTAYVQSHELAEGSHPPSSTALPQDTHVLRLGETAFLDVIARDTVYAVEGGVQKRSSRSFVLRDDTTYLADVARIAYEWYSINRVASSIRYQFVTGGALRGNLIDTIDDVTAAAIVSSVTWDFVNQTTEIFTHFAEPNFTELARG